MKLEEAKSSINCSKPKKIKELLFQYGVENQNLKSEIGLMNAIIDKCGIGGDGKTTKKSKKDGPKRPPSEWNIYFRECSKRRRANGETIQPEIMKACSVDYQKSKGK